jgi:RNA polymerase sigma-70 factor (ECF subfamily)
LAQEAFLKAYQSIGTLADAEKFASWLYRIAHNLAYSHLRRPTPVDLIDDGQGGGERWSGDWRENTGRMVPPPAFGRETEIAVATALSVLSPEQREAIILKIYHGFRFDEIAEIASCPLSTVKTRVYSGFAQLRTILEAERSSPVRARR